MSVKATSWVIHEVRGLAPGPKYLLLVLADMADNEQFSCYPSISHLADLCEASQATIRRWIGDLCAENLLIKKARFTNDEEGKIRRQSNRYFLNVPGQSEALKLSGSVNSYPQSAGQSEALKLSGSVNSYPQSAGQSEALKLSGSVTEALISSPPKRSQLCAIEPYREPIGIGTPTPTGQQLSSASSATGFEDEGRINSSLTSEQQALYNRCIPEPLRAPVTATRSVAKIVAELQRRLDAGWTAKQIYDALNARPLPKLVINPGGLLWKRLQADVAVENPPAAAAKLTETEKQLQPLVREFISDTKAGSPAVMEGFWGWLEQERPEFCERFADAIDNFDSHPNLEKIMAPVTAFEATLGQVG